MTVTEMVAANRTTGDDSIMDAINDLRSEAASAGDLAMSGLCARAMVDDLTDAETEALGDMPTIERAYELAIEALRDAEAQRD